MSDKTIQEKRAIFEKVINNPNLPDSAKKIAREGLAKLSEGTPKTESKKETSDSEKRAIFEKVINNPNIPDSAKKIAKEGLAKLDEGKPKTKAKKEKVVKQPKEKKEKVVKQPKEKKETTSVVDYDCDDLIAKEKDKAKKRKEAAEKRKDAPKKKESTKIKEGIEKLEDEVDEKVSKGKITKAEIIKLIDKTKALLKSLEKQLKEFGTKKMAEGGNIEESKFANMSAKDFVKEYSGINVFTSNPSEYFDIQKLATSNDNKVNEFIDKYKKEGYSIKKKSYSDFTHLFAAKRKDFKKMAEGGNVGDGDKFTYMMLGRLQSDNDYYLGNGNRSANNLWAGNVDAQIKEMKRLWNSLPENGKPEWLSMEDIKEYEKEMTSDKFAKGGSIKRTKTAIEADKNLRAMPKGERVSHPFAIIRKANGETFKRRNANQFGKVEGDGVYTENRANRTDKDQKKRF